MDNPPACCRCCYLRWRDARIAEDEARYNPSKLRPDLIKRAWAEHTARYSIKETIARFGRGYLRVAHIPPFDWAGLRVPSVGPEPVAMDTFDFYYRCERHPKHTVESFTCEGVRVWERITNT